ncbi:nitroreductase family protein [Roseomonas sp. SSH11]|uniref:Nitroreductase family protein n=1 Tax=Pararoseomonas baculiformis TaxID=2820812 RepID=A0ABS4AFM2_9PROT|nr:nitroreductase family protein [Pararoseomonas baculiformis]MBP0445801.1 nitroreductase family protein [Pararoseomonas baculiformis]
MVLLDRLLDIVKARFGSSPVLKTMPEGIEVLAAMANRRVMRRYTDKPVDPALLETLCAVALAAPSKSDLQQADIIIVSDKAQRDRLHGLIPDNPWIREAPALLVFCANNRRHRLMFEWRQQPFVNDHLDPFFNASVDAGIVLATFIAAADRVGLGSCPVSAIRNRAAEVSDLLGLPDHVFPVAGLGVGWPSFAGVLSPRLGLDVTIHHDRYDESGLQEKIAAYDRRRAAVQPYATQRYTDRFGQADDYGWSEDKVRQYSVPERADFGAFIRKKGFNPD